MKPLKYSKSIKSATILDKVRGKQVLKGQTYLTQASNQIQIKEKNNDVIRKYSTKNSEKYKTTN